MAIVYSEEWNVNDGSPDNGANYSRVTSPVYQGAGSLRINSPGTQSYWLKNASGSPAIVVFRVYIRFATFPDADLSYFITPYCGAAGYWGVAFASGVNRFECAGNSVRQASSGSISLGVWYRLDVKIDVSTSTNTADAKVNGVSLPQYSASSVSGSVGDYRIGDFATSASWDAYFDSFSVSHTSTDYPLGPSLQLSSEIRIGSSTGT